MQSSSAGGFHPHALTESDVTVSRHPALIVQPLTNKQTILPNPLAPPISGSPTSKAKRSNPFAPSPLQRFHHYYELVRPCYPALVLSHLWGLPICVSPLASGTGSHVPHKSLDQVAAFMPSTAQAVNRFPLSLSRSSASPRF